MQWIHHYQLFLFDFDGILVDTESLHYEAYLKVCRDRGFTLRWDQKTYMRHAIYSATGVREGIYKALPDLYRYEPCWDILYQEKKQAYVSLLHEKGVSLIPGVADLLTALEKAGINRCVVTHSPGPHIDLIRAQNPLLNTIPHWITREQYSQPKPSSECYLKALDLHRKPGQRVIGFEDSPRGLSALLGTDAEGYLVCDYFDAPELEKLRSDLNKPFTHVPSFSALFAKMAG